MPAVCFADILFVPVKRFISVRKVKQNDFNLYYKFLGGNRLER